MLKNVEELKNLKLEIMRLYANRTEEEVAEIYRTLPAYTRTHESLALCVTIAAHQEYIASRYKRNEREEHRKELYKFYDLKREAFTRKIKIGRFLIEHGTDEMFEMTPNAIYVKYLRAKKESDYSELHREILALREANRKLQIENDKLNDQHNRLFQIITE